MGVMMVCSVLKACLCAPPEVARFCQHSPCTLSLAVDNIHGLLVLQPKSVLAQLSGVFCQGFYFGQLNSFPPALSGLLPSKSPLSTDNPRKKNNGQRETKTNLQWHLTQAPFCYRYLGPDGTNRAGLARCARLARASFFFFFTEGPARLRRSPQGVAD